MTKDWNEDNIPDQSGRVAVVTGANSGIGLETARQLARCGATVIVAARSPERGTAALADIIETVPEARVELCRLDLASLTSVHSASDEILSAHGHIDLLINNAGVSFTKRSVTEDGFELQFGTNHIGHFALTALLLGAMVEVPGSRVVTIGSLGHRAPFPFDLDDVRAEGKHNRFGRYARSKLANLLFANELERRLNASSAETISVAAHPGGANTKLMTHVPGMAFMRRHMAGLAQTAAMGALPTLRAATDPDVIGGQYFGPNGLAQYRGYPAIVHSSARSRDPGLQAGLWQLSEEWTGIAVPLSSGSVE